MAAGPDLESVRRAKSRAWSVFSKLATVNGIGITKVDDEYALKVNLAEAPPAGRELPAEVDGVRVVVEVVGRIRAGRGEPG